MTESLKNIILETYKWIKVKKYKDDVSLSWEERFKKLEQHHIEETNFLINKIRSIVKDMPIEKKELNNIGYKLKINDNWVKVTHNDDTSLTLIIESEIDIIYFKEWVGKCKSFLNKKEYNRDIDYLKTPEKGILNNCFPVINENETMVKIYYDSKQVNEIY